MKNKEKLNILILNAYGDNRGDEAAVRAMIDSFRSKLPVGNIKIMITGKLDLIPYENVEVLKPFPYFDKRFSMIFLVDMLFTLITFGKLAFTVSGKKFLSTVDDADFIIHAPGGPSIGDLYSEKLVESYCLYRLLIPIVKGKPVFLYAPSVGPFSGLFKNLFRKFILKRINPLILRDKISSEYLKDQLELNSYVTIDSAFQNDILESYLIDSIDSKLLNLIKNEKIIGMTITDLSWHPKYRADITLRDKIVETLRGVAKFLTDEGYVIFLIPQLYREQGKFEIPLLENIQKINKEKIFILPHNLDSYAQQSIISKCFCVIGMRYHPTIFSAKFNVPSISIYYEHKAKGFMKELEREDLILNVEDIDEDQIIDKFKYLEKNYAVIHEQIRDKTPKLKQKSMETTNLILNELRNLKIT